MSISTITELFRYTFETHSYPFQIIMFFGVFLVTAFSMPERSWRNKMLLGSASTFFVMAIFMAFFHWDVHLLTMGFCTLLVIISVMIYLFNKGVSWAV